MRRLLQLSLIALPLFAAACGSDTKEPTAPVVTIEQTTFAPSLGVNLATMTKSPDGYYYKDLSDGTGSVARTNDSLIVNMTGYLADGTVFYTTDAGPLRFRLGTAGLLRGLTLGLTGAPVGATRRLILPPDLAYGSRRYVDVATNKVVAPNSVLVFDATVVSATP
jgi:FKBP-type peptidyl-prolyl cis-trans isomerase